MSYHIKYKRKPDTAENKVSRDKNKIVFFKSIVYITKTPIPP